MDGPTDTPVYATAREALRLGLSAVIVHAVGEPYWAKGPDGAWFRPLDPRTGREKVYGPKVPCGTWADRQTTPATPAELARYALDPEWGDRRGVALVCGYGGLECLEFDDPPSWDRFKAAAHADPAVRQVLARVAAGYFELSPRGAPHLLYRCEDLGGGGALARRPVIEEGDDGARRFQVLVETRGPGQMATVAPSPGTCHRSGRPWVLVRGGLATIAAVEPDERRALLDLARSFDEVGEDPEPEPPRPARPLARDPAAGERPGEHFSRVCSVEMWADMLGAWGWRYVGAVGRRPHCFAHPAAANAVSGHLTPGGRSLLVYSTSTPLAPWSPSRRVTHSAFDVYARVSHGGDHKAAARALAALGYGFRERARVRGRR